jgi:hypothetical protein
MTVNGIQLTKETILKTRLWFVQNDLNCIRGAVKGEFRVNNLKEYNEWRMRKAIQRLVGNDRPSLAFLQRALYIQTGECVPIFGP